ncbi:TTC28 [Branchiostoma lanceolatum]|uniref:TTC28 protein n=1 Tax=Branchiostoma lanceolatum TaxID=7740 RepID=A0A8J9ZVY7_BRALA|nr:TTC28 [Branchiostoma lanceolatum]
MFVEEIATSERSDGLRVRANLYDDGPICRALVHLHLLQFEEAKQSMYEALQKPDRDSKPDRTCSVLHHAGMICVELGLQEEARKCFQEALEIWPKTSSSAAHLQAHLLNAIGATFVDDPTTMRRYCQESLRVREKLFRGEILHEEEAGVNQNIAVSWIKEGQHSKAVHSFSKALSVISDGVVSPLLVTILSNMASCYSDMDLFGEAIVYAKRAANMAKTLYGEDTAHPTLALVLFSLGKIYSQRELHQDALSCHSLALQIRNRLFGREAAHERRAELLKAVAYSLLRLNEYNAAIRHYEEALALRKSTEKCVYYNNETVSLLNLLGHAHTMSGNPEKATEYQNEALKVGEAIYFGQKGSFQTEEMVDSLLYLAEAHVRRNDYQQAVEFYKAFLLARQQFPGFHSDENFARALNNLGIAYMTLGKDSAAATFLMEALDTLRNVPHGKAGRAIVACVYNLGHVLYNVGDYQAARGHYEEIANMKRRGETETADMDPVVLLSYLAATYQKLGGHNRAIEMCKEALEIHKGDDSKCTSATMGKIHKLLGRSLLVAERHQDAITHLEKAVDLLQMLDVEEKTQLNEIVSLYQNIATAYNHTGRSQSAVANYTKALGTLKMIHGEDACHIDIAGTLFNMAKSFVDFSRSGVLFSGSYRERAALLFEEAVTMTRRLDNDLDTRKLRASCLNNMADLHFDLQDFVKAATFYEELSREISSLPIGTYSDLEASALFYNLGVSFQRSNEATKAITALEKALGMKRLILEGEDGMYSIAMTLQALGDSLFLDRRYAEAVKHLEEAMDMRRNIPHDRDTLEMSSTLNSLGLALFYNGDKEKGIEHLQHAVRIRREVLGAFHPKLAESLTNLGNIHGESGNTAEGIRCYKEALGIWEDYHGRECPSTEVTTALYTIATEYARLGQEDESAAYYRRTLHQIRSLVRLNGKIPDKLIRVALWTVSVLLRRDSQIEEHGVDVQEEHTGEMAGVQPVLEVARYLSRYMTVTPPENGDVDLVMLALIVITDDRSSTTHDAEKAIAEEFTARQGAVSLAKYVIHVSTTVTSFPESVQQLGHDVVTPVSTTVTSFPESVQQVWQNVVTLRTVVWSLSAHVGEFCRQLAEGRLLTYLLTELGESADDDRPYLSEPPDFRTFLLTSATSILYNCARVQACRHHFHRDDKVPVLLMRHILDGDDVTIVRDVILTLAHISDSEDSFEVNVPSVREEVIQDFLTTSEKSLKEVSPEYSQGEMLLGVKFLVQNEQNREKIISQKGVGLLETLLEGDQEDALEIAASVMWLLLQ